MLEDEYRIALGGEGGGEILAAVIVDHLQRGLVALYLGIGDDPGKRVETLTEIAGHLAKQILPGNGNILLVKINTHHNIKFLIYKVRAKGALGVLRTGRNTGQTQQG